MNEEADSAVFQSLLQDTINLSV